MRTNSKLLRDILCGDSNTASKKAWEVNLSAKRFKDQFGDAVATDPGMQEGCFEWIRKVKRASGVDRVLCCPEDVLRSSRCKHDDETVCEHCEVPMCNDCWA